MKLSVNITTSDCCKLLIEDTSEYLNESITGTEKGNFKKSQTVSIDVLQHNKSTETVYDKPYFTLPDEDIVIPVKFDGWFTVIHIILPSENWFQTELNKNSGSALGLYNIVYYSDGERIYKYINGKIEEVTINEILEINIINTTISKIEKDYVSICYLRKCYINLCKQIFESRGLSSCWKDNKVDSELVFKRDLVWMAINVIKYLTECNQLAEVERILEIISGCNGLCSNSNNTSKTNGCGCQK